MDIPKEFSLMGHTIEVKQIKIPPGAKEDFETSGSWDKNKHTINIYHWGQPDTFIEHTYLHEILHAALDAMGKDDLSKDEEFVDCLAGLLHQVFTTGVE